MTAPVKLGLGAVGTLGTATSVYYAGGYLLNQPEVKQDDLMPSWRPLSEDSEFLNSSDPKQLSTEFSGKYAADKARLLVGTGSDDKHQVKNKGWWDWIFRNKYEQSKSKDTFKGGFANLTRGAKESSDQNSLQEACDKAYKAETSKIKANNPSDDEFEEAHVWLLCSVVDAKPKTVADAEKDTNSEDKKKLGDTSAWKEKWGANKKSDLLAIYDSGNAKVWEELNKQYVASQSTDGFFKREGDSPKDIKNKCEEAYGKSSPGTGDSDPKEDDLYKWCSLKGYKSN